MPRHSSPPVTYVCPTCGDPFERWASQVATEKPFCSRHCARAFRKPLAERFWERVRKTDGCWLWTGGRMMLGYGRLEEGRGLVLLAHRVSWQLHHGPIPEGVEVCHNCPGGDNPSCVNPAHLFLGTHADNMRDAGVKKMMAHGERHPHAKVTEEIVRTIRNRYAAGDITQQQLADESNLALSTVCCIIHRKAWSHVV